jgi:hypothetical protein
MVQATTIGPRNGRGTLPSEIGEGKWRKTSHSIANGQCVEITQDIAGRVLVRDSTDPDNGTIAFRAPGWRYFIERIDGQPPNPRR